MEVVIKVDDNMFDNHHHHHNDNNNNNIHDIYDEDQSMTRESSS